MAYVQRHAVIIELQKIRQHVARRDKTNPALDYFARLIILSAQTK
jgi:hypothetical protein